MIFRERLLLISLVMSFCFCKEILDADRDFLILKMPDGKNQEKIKEYLLKLSSELGFDIFFGGVQLKDSPYFSKGIQLFRFGFFSEDDFHQSNQSIDGVVSGKFYAQGVGDQTLFLIRSREFLLDIQPGTPLDKEKEDLRRCFSNLVKTEDLRVFLMQK